MRLLFVFSFISFLSVFIQDIDLQAADCWAVTDSGLILLSESGEEILRVKGTRGLDGLAVDSSDGSFWALCRKKNSVFVMGSLGKKKKKIARLTRPGSVALCPVDGSCWIADLEKKQVIRYDRKGNVLARAENFNFPFSLAADQNDGGCWVMDPGSRTVVRLSKQGEKLVELDSFNIPFLAVVSPGDSSCWIADRGENLIVLVDEQGDEICRSSSFDKEVIQALAVNPEDGSCWVATEGKIYKLDRSGRIVNDISGFEWILSMSYDPMSRKLWVADRNGNRIVCLNDQGVKSTVFHSAGFPSCLQVRSCSSASTDKIALSLR